LAGFIQQGLKLVPSDASAHAQGFLHQVRLLTKTPNHTDGKRRNASLTHAVPVADFTRFAPRTNTFQEQPFRRSTRQSKKPVRFVESMNTTAHDNLTFEQSYIECPKETVAAVKKDYNKFGFTSIQALVVLKRKFDGTLKCSLVIGGNTTCDWGNVLANCEYGKCHHSLCHQYKRKKTVIHP
jgi:hypothetical protein